MKNKILLFADCEGLRRALESSDLGFEILTANTREEALAAIEANKFHVFALVLFGVDSADGTHIAAHRFQALDRNRYGNSFFMVNALADQKLTIAGCDYFVTLEGENYQPILDMLRSLPRRQ